MDRNRRKLLVGGTVLGAATLAGVLPASCGKGLFDRQPGQAMNSIPKRPSGDPKPLLEEDIAPVLARLDAWYAANLDPARYGFNAPATDAQLDAFEQEVGIKMPGSYRQLYKWHDGENDDRWGHIYGLPLLPLRYAAADWRQWQKTLAAFDGNPYMVPGRGWPDGAVDPAYINPGWIPLTSDGSSGHIGLDFDPWPGGRIGQVILYGRDEDVKAVLAPSLGQFLEWIAGLLESGNFRLTSAPGEVVLRQFRLKHPPTDHFHDGARILVGAPGQFV